SPQALPEACAPAEYIPYPEECASETLRWVVAVADRRCTEPELAEWVHPLGRAAVERASPRDACTSIPTEAIARVDAAIHVARDEQPRIPRGARRPVRERERLAPVVYGSHAVRVDSLGSGGRGSHRPDRHPIRVALQPADGSSVRRADGHQPDGGDRRRR